MASAACASCAKSPPEVKLKHCVQCPEVKYCGRPCQTAHWPIHRAVCNSQTGSNARSAGNNNNNNNNARSAGNTNARSGATATGGSSSASAGLSPPKGLEKGIAKPFTHLDKGTWLHDRPPKDVYALLVDAYRLRVEDMYNLEGEIEPGSLYGGAPNGLAGFRRFLARVAARPGLLPPWWDADKKKECEDLGMDAGQWHDLRCAVEKSDIIEHYGDGQFPMQLRMFAEAVYGGPAPGGFSGTAMRTMMMAMEQGGMGDMQASSFDISSMLKR
ncbi:hypothetical protein NHJ6243_003717 [Beauveria neobassiana]